MIELTKNNKFGLKSPAIARHLIIHNNIYQFGKQVKLILILLLLLLLLLLVVVEVLVNLPDTNAVTSLADLLLTTWWALLVQCAPPPQGVFGTFPKQNFLSIFDILNPI